MLERSAEPTNARNLEAKFDAGEDVLDYFDPESATVILPDKLAAPQTASVSRLHRAIQIAEQIQTLEKELISILEAEMSAARSSEPTRAAGVD